jgi:predicted nucleotide-binding protein
MARRKQPPQPESKVLTADDLRTGIRKLQRRIDDLTQFDVSVIEERFDSKASALTDKINSTLADIFGRDTPEYNHHSIWSLDTLPLGGPKHPINVVREAYQKGINDAVTRLVGIKETLEEKLEDLEESTPSPGSSMPEREPPGNGKVFIVHGHDELAKQTVARFMSQLDLTPVILHEQPNEGRTIIEKLEAHTSVDFAVVLLTPDDIGYLVNAESKKQPRARQNVLLELGLFIGVLGRPRVCALYKQGVEIPSDYQGVLFTEMDDAGAWKLSLAREIRQTGIDVDMNKAL